MADRSIKQARRNMPERFATVRGDLSQRAFAAKLGTFQQNVNRYEKAGTAPHVDQLITIALKTGTSLDWLILNRGPQFAKGARRRLAS